MAKAPTRKYSPRRSRAERREQLLDAALDIVDAQGFDAFSIEAVAREAQLAKTVVYANFDSPLDLLCALTDRELDRAMADLAAAIPRPPYADPGAVLQEALTDVLAAARRHPKSWRLFVTSPDGLPAVARAHVEEQHARFRLQLEPLVAWGLERLDLAHLDAEVTTHMVIAAAEHGIRMALLDPEHFTDERLIRFVTDFVQTVVVPRQRG